MSKRSFIHRPPHHLPTSARAARTAGALLLAGAALIACENTGGGTPDAGDNPNCSALVTADVQCQGAACSATTGTKTFGISDLASSVAKDWLVLSYATNEVSAADVAVNYASEAAGGLTPKIAARSPRHGNYSAEDQARLTRLQNEALLRQASIRGPIQGPAFGTAVRGVDLLPPGVRKQTQTCSADAPKSCGAGTICVIPEGMTAGTCEGTVMLKFKLNQPDVTTIAATVKKVGESIAIVVDPADNLSDADATELVRRFDSHIGPTDQALFGEAKQAGKDRDGNGVVMVLVTSKLATALPGTVGIFFRDDLRTTAEAAHSNAADLLYVAPLGGSITLDSLSGTIAHEYEHLINFYAKVLINHSDQEETWLDEGLATFAEDVNGYGRDAYGNVKLFLDAAGSVSLNGPGVGLSGPDSLERRGMAALLVRYLFEQKGSADFAATGAPTDKGGLAAVKKMVQSAETGLDVVNAVENGKTYGDWLKDFLLTVAIDGSTTPSFSCLKKYNLEAPATDGFTGFQRGLDLRGTVTVTGGTNIVLHGPQTTTFMTEEGVPLPENGGDFRTVSVPSGTTKVSLGGPVDAHLFLVAIPKP
ncbi:MAG: hypothetical protein U1E65_05210 [Myxococcota bacterium]